MKKTWILLLTVAFVVGAVGCGNQTKNIGQEVSGEAISGKTNSKKEDTKKQKSKEENIVNDWIQSVLNDYNYEKQFDSAVYGESDGQKLQSLLKEKLKIKILYSDDEFILVHLSIGAQQSGYLALVLEDGNWMCTENNQLNEIYGQQLCSDCSGLGTAVVGTHTEYGQYACGICGGTGWTSNTYYDAALGWQTIQIGCGGCGGAGWLTGAHQVNDYGTCEKCDGEGAFVIEGELELEEESDMLDALKENGV